MCSLSQDFVLQYVDWLKKTDVMNLMWEYTEVVSLRFCWCQAWTLLILKSLTSFCIFSESKTQIMSVCLELKKKKSNFFCSGVLVCVHHRKNSQGLEASDRFRRIARAQVKSWPWKDVPGEGLKVGDVDIWRIMGRSCWRLVAWGFWYRLVQELTLQHKYGKAWSWIRNAGLYA